jgi:TonB family protein
MPITQIPFQDPPVASPEKTPPEKSPPEKPEPEQLELYASRDWETAYRELDARVPHLLIQLQDDLERARWREAVWISIIVHLVLAIAIWNAKMIGKYVGWHTAVVVPLKPADKDVTFLQEPPDLQKVPHKPNTNIASDKDRIAMTRHPELDPKELKKILATPPPGAPGPSGPRAAAQPSPPPQPAPNQSISPQPQQGEPSAPRPQFETNQTAQNQTPPRPNNSFSKYQGGMSPGSAIQQAAQDAANRRASGGGGQEGGFGLGSPGHGRQEGALEILSDTQGVDFGPYLQRVLQEVKQNWYLLIPQSAEMKKGKLSIEFAITKDGKVANMLVRPSSGDVALDRPAWGSITNSNPFPPLPTEFTGPELDLRFTFFYCATMPFEQCMSGLQ